MTLKIKADTVSESLTRYSLGFLSGFLALNAFGGGYYGMAGADGVPLNLLEGSPFSSYFIPGLILFVVVGGSLLCTSMAVFAQWKVARLASFASVIIVTGWLAVQVAIIGYVSWMQPVTAIVTLIIFVLACLYQTGSKVQAK